MWCQRPSKAGVPPAQVGAGLGLRAKPRRAAQTQQMARASRHFQRLQEHTPSRASRKGSLAAMGGQDAAHTNGETGSERKGSLL